MKAQNSDSQADMTPTKAFELLRDGNRRFVSNLRANRDLLQQVSATSSGQWPFAAVLGCIDSRVSPEIVFDQGMGDIFSVRVAGNFTNTDIQGSLEFSCKVAGARLVVVLGHRHCGAVKGACDDVQLGALTSMLANLKPAVNAIEEPTDPAERTSANPAFVHAVAEQNVRMTVAKILAESTLLAEMRAAGEIDVVGAMYDVETGEVDFL